MTAAISIENLSKTYANGHQALKGISMEVNPGDFFALLGPNGAGKSTTIGIIATLVKKTAGRVEVYGRDVDTHVFQTKQDLGIVTFSDKKKNKNNRCFMLNASLGVTAEANSYFNSEHNIIHFLKNVQVMLAIWYAAIRSIIRFRNIPAAVNMNGEAVQMYISNLAVIKQNFISGGFHTVCKCINGK